MDCGFTPPQEVAAAITAKWMLSINGDGDTLVFPTPISRSLAIRRESEGPHCPMNRSQMNGPPIVQYGTSPAPEEDKTAVRH